MPKVSTLVCLLSGTSDDCPVMEHHIRANGDTDESAARVLVDCQLYPCVFNRNSVQPHLTATTCLCVPKSAIERETELLYLKRIDTIMVSSIHVSIGGTSVGLYGCMLVTKLDSHANMDVAGRDCTIIATSGQFATVTPFYDNHLVMEKVEIGDVAIAYDNPITLQTYLLVLRNALLIPTMDHNLLPPFLVREVSLFIEKTPKFQSTSLSRNNHTICDNETGLRIDLQLNGTFLYFPTRALTIEEQSQWDEYPVVFLTPDGD